MDTVENPFNITKAVEFSDQEILKLWVDWPSDGGSGLTGLIKPTSPMPMFVVGGKGSGKTHLIRFFSFALQKIRHAEKYMQGVKDDGYIGIYLRCGGLNPSRFSGKGISPDQWDTIFCYFIDLWFAYNSLQCIKTLCNTSNDLEQAFCEKMSSLFDVDIFNEISTIQGYIDQVTTLQRQLNYEVNNCVFTGEINIEITTTRGNLVFGIPKIFMETFPEYDNILFLYLVDEYENFSIDQQKYLNTLIREKEGPCSFKIGARLFGIKTHTTYCDEEENKEGSEFEYLKLDAYYRDSNKYSDFAQKIIKSRLEASGILVDASQQTFDSWFVTIPKDTLGKAETAFVNKTFLERPHLKKFKQYLDKAFSKHNSHEILAHIRCDDAPILEKAAVNVLYKSWGNPDDLMDISKKLKLDIEASLDKESFTGQLEKVQHFKSDFIAQLYRDFGKQVQYSGLDSVIEISWGNPRHLLMILKRIFSWAIFKNEITPGHIQISVESQNSGIKESSDWFFNDAKQIGSDGEHVQESIERLCDLVRAIRYSEKPSECSVCAFSVETAKISSRSKHSIKMAKQWSLLVNVGTHTDKNTGSKIDKYQINRLLSPRWGIAMSRRGTIQLNPDEVDSIFDEGAISNFEVVKKIRLDRMTPPFGLKFTSSSQIVLPGVGND